MLSLGALNAVPVNVLPVNGGTFVLSASADAVAAVDTDAAATRLCAAGADILVGVVADAAATRRPQMAASVTVSVPVTAAPRARRTLQASLLVSTALDAAPTQRLTAAASVQVAIAIGAAPGWRRLHRAAPDRLLQLREERRNIMVPAQRNPAPVRDSRTIIVPRDREALS